MNIIQAFLATGMVFSCHAPNSPPPDWETPARNDFSPFESKESFLLADLLFQRTQMPQGQIDDLMQNWARTLPLGQDPPFADVRDLYETIDAIELGNVKWQSFSISFCPKEGEEANDTPWKLKSYDVWYRDPWEILKGQLSNCDFAGEIDFAAKKVIDAKTKIRRFQDFMYVR